MEFSRRVNWLTFARASVGRAADEFRCLLQHVAPSFRSSANTNRVE